jgi:hypothetical protein
MGGNPGPHDNSEAQACLDGVVSVLRKWQQHALAICERILGAAIKLQRLAQAIAGAQEEHAARCYTAHFKDEKLPVAEAEALGWLVPRLGAQFQQRRWVERSAAQLLSPLERAKTTLVISRQARLLREHCEQGSEIGEALYGAGLTESREGLRSLLKAASERGADACGRLQSVASRAYRTLPKSRGRKLTLENATHAVFLAILKEEGKCWTYSWSEVEGCFSDARTAVTSKALNLYSPVGHPTINSRSAHKLVRAGAVR